MPNDYGSAYGSMQRSPRFRRSSSGYADPNMDMSGYGGAPAADTGGAGGYPAFQPGLTLSGRWGGGSRPAIGGAPYQGYGGGNAFLNPQGQFSGNQGVGAIIPDFYRQGAFDPSGGGAYLEAAKADLAAREGQDVAQAGMTSDIYGGDNPLAQQYGRLRAEQSARDRYGSVIPQLRAQAAARREQEIYALLQQRLGNVDYYRQPKTDYGAIAAGTAGDILGKVAGAKLK
jgi:hypothetical protein